MLRKYLKLALAIIIALIILGLLIYQIPAVNQRLSWRVDAALVYIQSVFNPVEDVPIPEITSAPPVISTLTPVPQITNIPSSAPTATPIPAQHSLESPEYEAQGWNNCGPATLSMYLDYYGWPGDQYDIATLTKPDPDDKNVNVEELRHYVRTEAGWLNAEFRVGGDIGILKTLISNGFPVMIETGLDLDENYYVNDDRWAGHYLLLTGYDDAAQSFTTHDSLKGGDIEADYSELESHWKAFNHVYLIVYLPSQEDRLIEILGEDWDPDINREKALQLSSAILENDPEDAFEWFNRGSNLFYFDRWDEADQAYDQARIVGIPQRMMRYQFGPFFAYFRSERYDDLLTVVNYALNITNNSEEALLWKGWAVFQQGDYFGAIEYFRRANNANPYNPDALHALQELNAEP
jgi:hypothetical protein